MSREERATTLEIINPILTIPFADLHQWIEELAGRPVWTHELGTGGFARLAAEVRSGQPATLEDVIEHVHTVRSGASQKTASTPMRCEDCGGLGHLECDAMPADGGPRYRA
jgi:hypothetical protein